MRKYKSTLIICLIFSTSMAFMESAIVVYLREIFYPEGFAFPLKQIEPFIFWIEIGREASTIIMLWAIAKLISKNKNEWFAFFSFNFAVWDIWYYIWLKIFLAWPQSLLTWDVLFLIPIPWIAPVLAPVLVSIALLIAALIILSLEAKNKPLKFSKLDWSLEGLAGLIIIGSFLFQTSIIAANSIPVDFPWWLFSFGMIFGLLLFGFKVQKSIKQ